MILFEKIRWKNVLSTGNTFTEVDLNVNKSTLIVGENGSGKSTILDALSFCLYGKPFRNVNKGQLINSVNKKSMEVQVEFSIDKKKYKVIRGIKPNIFEIYCNDQLLDQHAESKQYQDMFEKQILKLNHKSFNQIVILGSASFVPFMQLNAATRREIIEDLLDIEIFSRMNQLLKDRIVTNRQDIAGNSYSINTLSDKIQLNKQFEEAIKQNNQNIIDNHNKEIQLLKAANKFLLENIDLNVSLHSTAKIQEAHFQLKITKYNELSSLEKKINEKIQKIKDEIAFFTDNNNCPTCKQKINGKFKKESVEEKYDNIQKLENGLTKLQQEMTELKPAFKDFTSFNKTVLALQESITSEKAAVGLNNKLIQNYNSEIQKLQEDAPISRAGFQDVGQWKIDLELANTNQEKLLKNKQIFEIGSVLLKDTGIKTKIIKQYVSVINKLINKYLAAMDFFVNFELNENFEEKIRSRFRDEFSYASFSEGEKMRIDLALLFTWRAIAKLRNSTSTNLLIMDEVFDSSLDNSGTEEFMKILNNLTLDTNTLIISHKGDQLADKFTNIIRFEKHKNFSRMTQ